MSPIDRLRRDDPPFAAVLDRLTHLTNAEADGVENAAQRIGLGVTDESADTMAIMLSTAMVANREAVRALAQRAGQEAAAASAGDRSAVISAAGVLAEVFAIRGLLDAKTWEFLTTAWSGVIDVPCFGEERVGAASVVGERIREEVERHARQMEKEIRNSMVSDVSWVATLRNRANDPAFSAAMMQAGLSRTESERLLSIIRREVENRIRDGMPVAEVSMRRLYDLARACQQLRMDAWDGAIAALVDDTIAEADELNELMDGPYDKARGSLVTYLRTVRMSLPAASGLILIQDEVLPGLHAVLVLHGGKERGRPVTTQMLDAWDVRPDDAWRQASHNMARASIRSDPWPDPSSSIRRVWSERFEAEFLGLIAHRLPDASAAGHIVGLPFRGSALILALDAVPPLQAVAAFASVAACSYREAARFDDQLYPNLLWLRPDGTPMVLGSILEPMADPSHLPSEFQRAAAALVAPGGRA